jgi:hypothetical protein
MEREEASMKDGIWLHIVFCVCYFWAGFSFRGFLVARAASKDNEGNPPRGATE